MHDISDADRAISRWLKLCLVLIFSMVILGGITRLVHGDLASNLDVAPAG